MIGLKNCPDCAAPLGRDAHKCRCGWMKAGGDNPDSGRCIVEADGQRCYFPGTLSESTHGGKWICRLHWQCPPEVVVPVIEESRIWYELSRAGHDVPATYKRFDGKDVLGFKTRTFRKFRNAA